MTVDLNGRVGWYQWLATQRPELLLISGRLVRFQKGAIQRWCYELLAQGKELAFTSGNHDFYSGEKAPIIGASPEWMVGCGSICDGQTGLLEKDDMRVAIGEG